MPFPDIIFLDINMPAMDGWEFLEKYSELKDSLPHYPVVIMLSTSLNPDDELRAQSIPEISEFFNKPMTLEMIALAIAKYFTVYQ